MPLITQGNPDHFGGATVKPKTRSVVTQVGHTSVVQWQLLDELGNPINLTTYGASDSPDANNAFFTVDGANRETPAGTINGSNTRFMLANSPLDETLLLFVNGLLQQAGSSYTKSGQVITFLSGSVPQVGDSLDAQYFSLGTTNYAPVGSMVEVRFAEYSSLCRHTVFAEILSASQGLVQFVAPENILCDPGIWLLQFSVVPNESLRFFGGSGYFCVNAGPDQAQAGVGAPSIPEIRMFLRDFAAENEFLDAVDFDVSEMLFAATMCINQWNEMPPLDGPNFTTQNFPFRYHWLIGISAKLFQIAAEHYARNMLAYEAGGKTMDDKNRFSQYRQKAIDAKQEWETFAKTRKSLMSANAGGYMEIGGIYSMFGGGW